MNRELLLTILALAFMAYFGALWFAPRLDWRRARWWVLGVAVAARLACLPLPFTLSDDVYRYLWEGKIQNAGFNPYRQAPASPELAPLRDDNWQRVAHKEVPTIYSPLLLLVFRGAATVCDSPIVFKFVFAGFDLLTFWALVRWLRARGQNESLALVWALNPLVIVEFAGMGHAMSLAIFCFTMGLWGLDQGKAERMAGAWFGLAGLAHLLALPLVLAVRMRSWRSWLTCVGVIVAGYIPFADAGRDLFSGVIHFAGRWRHNGSIFDVLVWLLRDGSVRQVAGGVWLSYERTKLVCAVALTGVLMWVWWRRYQPSRAALTVAGTLLLLSSTVHPWYLTWLVALASVEWRWAWLIWSGTVLLSYANMPRGLEYAPVGVALIWEVARSMVRRRWLQKKPLTEE